MGQGPEIKYKRINAKAEIVFDKPALPRAHPIPPCLIPAQGIVEWGHEAPGDKAADFTTLVDGGITALAGIFKYITMPDGRHIQSVPILTRYSEGVAASSMTDR